MLRRACSKLAEFDEHLQAAVIQLPHRAFRAVFAYSLDGGDSFNDWHSPDIFLTRYAAEVACQPDALFVVNSHFPLLTSSQSVGKVYALHWGYRSTRYGRGTIESPNLSKSGSTSTRISPNTQATTLYHPPRTDCCWRFSRS
jgi:hypothetical protein